jgi:hypothetical protein
VGGGSCEASPYPDKIEKQPHLASERRSRAGGPSTCRSLITVLRPSWYYGLSILIIFRSGCLHLLTVAAFDATALSARAGGATGSACIRLSTITRSAGFFFRNSRDVCDCARAHRRRNLGERVECFGRSTSATTHIRFAKVFFPGGTL